MKIDPYTQCYNQIVDELFDQSLMDWGEIKFDDNRGKVLAYSKKDNRNSKTKPKPEQNIDNVKNNDTEYFFQCVNWSGKMRYDVYYDLKFVKSCIKNYNRNILFESLDVINEIGLKKIINDYLLIRDIDLNIISRFDRYSNGSDYYALSIYCGGKVYEFKCRGCASIISFSIHSETGKLLNNWDFSKSHKYIYNSVDTVFTAVSCYHVDTDELNVLYDVLFTLKEIIKTIKWVL